MEANFDVRLSYGQQAEEAFLRWSINNYWTIEDVRESKISYDFIVEGIKVDVKRAYNENNKTIKFKIGKNYNTKIHNCGVFSPFNKAHYYAFMGKNLDEVIMINIRVLKNIVNQGTYRCEIANIDGTVWAIVNLDDIPACFKKIHKIK